MSEPIFGADDVAPVVLDQDQDENARLEQLKTKYTKEDGTVDIDGLLKKAVNADMHIPKIEEENLNLRKKVDESLTFRDLLDKINAQRAPASTPADRSDERGQDPQKGVTEADLETLVEKVTLKKQQEAVQVSNVKHVASELQKVWGRDFESKLRARVQEFGLSEDQLRSMIRNSPKALLSLVLPVKEDMDNSYTPPQSSSRVSSGSSTNTRNWKYYQAMMKNDRKKYDSVEMQNEIHAAAEKLGEGFYK